MRGSGVTRWERLRGPGRNWSKIPQLATVSCLQPAERLEAALILSHVLCKLPPSQPHESQRSVGRSKALLLPGSCLRDASCQNGRLGTGGPRHSPFWEQQWKEQKTIISSIGHQYPDPGSPAWRPLSPFPFSRLSPFPPQQPRLWCEPHQEMDFSVPSGKPQEIPVSGHPTST